MTNIHKTTRIKCINSILLHKNTTGNSIKIHNNHIIFIKTLNLLKNLFHIFSKNF